MTFDECVVFCAGNRELLVEFDRLFDAHLSQRRTGIEAMVDQATGRDAEAWAKFTVFVWDCVWTRLPQECFTDSVVGISTKQEETTT